MTKQQLDAAATLAQDPNERFIDDKGRQIVDLTIFEGYALNGFKEIYCTIRQVAALVRWQCLMLNGEMNGEELNNLAHAARHKFNIIG
jgi:hypothetical protein